MSNLAGKPPLGLNDRDKPKEPKTRKPVRKVSRKREAYLASQEREAGKAHMAKVASLPCVCCGYWPVEVHHCKSGGPRSDMRVIPLCHNHHRGPEGFHTQRETWEGLYGLDADYLPVVADMIAGEWVNPWRGR